MVTSPTHSCWMPIGSRCAIGRSRTCRLLQGISCRPRSSCRAQRILPNCAKQGGQQSAKHGSEPAKRVAPIQCGQITHNGTCGDELIDRAVRAIGGYGVIAMCDRDKLAFLERRFAEHYADIESVDDVREAV